MEARILEAKREGWFGEIEGLQVSLSGAKDKLTQIDASLQRQTSATELGMPTFARIVEGLTPGLATTGKDPE